MLVLTFQKPEIADMIRKGLYHVDLSKSNFGHESIRFTLGYRRILSNLREKCSFQDENEGCIWGWVSSPDPMSVRNYMNWGYVAVFVNINPAKAVLSDYAMFSDYVLGESNNSSFILRDRTYGCTQVSFTIESIVSFEGIYDCSMICLAKSIDFIYSMVKLKSSLQKSGTNFKLRTKVFAYQLNKLRHICYKVKCFYISPLPRGMLGIK